MSWRQWRSLVRSYSKRLQAVFRDEDLYYRFFALFLAIVLWFFAGGRGRLLTTDQQPIPAAAAVIPRFEGELAPGLGLQSFAVVPEAVSVSVSPDLAGTIDALVTEPIRLTGLAAGEYDLIIGVVRPAGVEINGSPTVQVKLVITQTESHSHRPVEPESRPVPAPPLIQEPAREPEPNRT